MKVCMITTFFGAESFGGDAVYVERLSRALLRAGHDVHVIHCADSFNLLRGSLPARHYTQPAGLQQHTLRSGFGALSPLASHQTGRPYFKRRAIMDVLDTHQFDVIHYHNISLIGGPEVLMLPARGRPVRFLSAHEHWLACPLSLLWKYDRQVCDKPTCIRCTLRAGRPPQIWRLTSRRERALDELDALIAPSLHTLHLHQQRGLVSERNIRLPYFIDPEWSQEPQDGKSSETTRPYLLMAGRLVKEKGFQDVIPLMRRVPQFDLRIAGAGNYEASLRRLATGAKNIRFEGMLGFAALAKLMRGATAVIVPSLFYETFGYVALESFAVGTPVIVRNRGALPELIEASRAGFTFHDESDLMEAIARLSSDRDLREKLSHRALQAVDLHWSEAAHLRRYTELISACRQATTKQASGVHSSRECH